MSILQEINTLPNSENTEFTQANKSISINDHRSAINTVIPNHRNCPNLQLLINQLFVSSFVALIYIYTYIYIQGLLL